jgi:ribosome-associated protein
MGKDNLTGKVLLDTVVDACVEAKGIDIKALDVKETFGLCDYFVIVSGRSDRQVQGICNKIIKALADHQQKPYSVEGVDKGHWALVDCGDVIVHAFYEPIREQYDLESLWNRAKEVKLNIKENSELNQVNQ